MQAVKIETSTARAPNAVAGLTETQALGQAICARYRRAARAVLLLEQLLPDMGDVTKAAVDRIPIEQSLNAMTLLTGAQLSDALRQCNEQVRNFEKSVERLDRKIPMAWFRKNCHPTHEDAEGYADFASLLSQNLSGAEDNLRMDRVQLIVTRVVESQAPRARASTEQRRALVIESLPETQLDEATRAPAVAYLNSAITRLREFKHLDELMDSSFFMETRGYKLALRQKMLDPAIMAAAIEVNDAIDLTVERLATSEAGRGVDPRKALADADARLKELFGKLRSEDDTVAEKGFAAMQAKRESYKEKKREEEAAVARKEARKEEKERWKPKKAALWPRFAVLAVLGGLLYWRLPSRVDMKELSADERAALSPLIAAARVTPSITPVMLMGRVNHDGWSALSQAERQAAAQQLRIQASIQGLENLTLFDDRFIAVQIRTGEVLIVH